MSAIRIAVWNLEGLMSNSGDYDFIRHKKKINRMLDWSYPKDGKKADLIFFQEISMKFGPLLPYRWFFCREKVKEEGYCRGILLYVDPDSGLAVDEPELPDRTNPVGACYTVRRQGQPEPLFRFAGFWNIPVEESKKQSVYLGHLEDMIRRLEIKKSGAVPYVIAGDTNVNLDSNVDNTGENNPAKCGKRRKKLEDFLAQHGLALIGFDGTDGKVFSLDFVHSGKFFRCDLLMVSETIRSQIDFLIPGCDPATFASKLHSWDSDHIPLVFDLTL